MEFTINVDLNELLEKKKLKISEVDEIIKSKKKDLAKIEKFRKDLLNEKLKIVEEINKIKKLKILLLHRQKKFKIIHPLQFIIMTHLYLV